MKKIIGKLYEKDIVFDFIYLFLTLILCSSVFLILTYILYKKPLFDQDDLMFLNPEKLLVYMLIIPLIEEFGIRGVFDLSNKVFISLFVISSIIVVFTFVSQIWLSIFISILIFIFGILLFFNLDFRCISNTFVENNYIYLLFITSITFGLLHLNNYEVFDTLTFLKIIPRILGGFYLGYIAYKYGILYSYLMHGLNNLFPFIIIFIYSSLK